jgi:uncharacterized membrane protein
MKDLLIQTFADHRILITFLHVVSAVIWVGGMIAIRLATTPAMALITDPKMRLERMANILKRLFTIVLPFVIILIVTAVLMAVGLGFRDAAVDPLSGAVIDPYAMSLYNTIHIKEVIWIVMTLNLFFMMYLRKEAQYALLMNNLERAKGLLSSIANFLVPLNILLGMGAIFIGVFLRNAY